MGWQTDNTPRNTNADTYSYIVVVLGCNEKCQPFSVLRQYQPGCWYSTQHSNRCDNVAHQPFTRRGFVVCTKYDVAAFSRRKGFLCVASNQPGLSFTSTVVLVQEYFFFFLLVFRPPCFVYTVVYTTKYILVLVWSCFVGWSIPSCLCVQLGWFFCVSCVNLVHHGITRFFVVFFSCLLFVYGLVFLYFFSLLLL